MNSCFVDTDLFFLCQENVFSFSLAFSFPIEWVLIFLLNHVNRKFFLFNNMYLFVSYEIITTFAPQNFLLINIKQRFMNNYETVFILTPVLSDAQMKEAVEKFTNLLKEQGAEIVNEENWGLRKLAYPIDKKTTGFYQLVEFKANPETIATLEINFRRDERVIRFLTFRQDKYAAEYAAKRRSLKSSKETVKEN